jgi:hypothetical protein
MTSLRGTRVVVAAVSLVAIAAVLFAGSRSGATDAGSSSAPPAAAGVAAAPRPHGLHVVGDALVDGHGRHVQLRGVNRSGTEYACIQGWGIFDGPSDAASVRAMASWHVNAVRIPLNEDCWLGINGVDPKYGGASYRRAIAGYVRLLRRHHIYPELSLMWGAPGTQRATYQPDSPDRDHSPAFWSSLARTFAHQRNVILAPWGETVVGEDCFLRGGSCGAAFGPARIPYETAGMQEAVTRMRRAGYRGVIAIPGVDYANDLSGWLSHEPRDPGGLIVAEAHVYGGNTCSTPSCFDATLAPIARRVPLILGEAGEGEDCGSARMASIVGWADAHRIGYLAWTWDTWGNCEALISNYSGTPRGPYGSWVRAHDRRKG